MDKLTFEPAAGNPPFRFESTGMDPNDPWRLHASGVLRNGDTAPMPPPLPSDTLPNGQEIRPARFYKGLDERGLSYGAAFRGITELRRDGDQVFAKVALPVELDGEAGVLHPAFLDACLHVYAALFEQEDLEEQEIYVPIGIDAFHLYRSAANRAWVHGVALERRGDNPAEIKLDIRVYGDDRQPIALFQGLTVRRTGKGMLAPFGQGSWQRLLYSINWREIPDAEPSPPSNKHWYILSDAAAVGDRLAEALGGIGCSSIVVSPETPLTDELLATATAAPLGIVDLRALDASTTDPAPFATRACGGCLDLIKLLDRVRDRLPHPPRLWLVTCGAQGCGDTGAMIEPAQSALWGLGRTFALEYPEMWGGLIDLPPGAPRAVMVDCLMRQLSAAEGEDQVAFRGGKRLAPRFAALRLAHPPKNTALSPDAAYWIVGGLGRLGLRVAEAFVAAGARHLVLTGRNPAPPETAGTLEKLRRHAEVVVHPADVACAAEVGDALDRIRKSMPPLKGVVHAAAVFEDAVLSNTTTSMFERVMRPKISGAWNLHNATRELPLDFFILYSSVLSLWGAAGQGAYAAANGFLDGLAAHRRGSGLPATVINWGPWDDAVTLERWGQARAALWKQRATAAVPAAACLEILASLLCDGPVQVAVTDTRWPDFMAQFREQPPLFRELAPAAAAFTAVSARNQTPSSIAETVAWHAGQVLGLDGRIDAERPLNELGLDFLLAVALANRLRQALNLAVPTAVLLKGPSISELVVSLFPGLERPPEDAVPAKASTARVEAGGWLVTHRPNPAAAVRLFGFPFAGGGAATFRMWSEHLDPSIELIAIEPPGRQTRIDEAPIREIGDFVRQLVPALLPSLDKPFAVYGHCLGALTLFETVRALINQHRIAPIHIFISGARTPDELHSQQAFETDLIERLLQLPGYNLFEPIHRQPDDVFSEAIRRFNVLATERLVRDPELRRLILPAIRAEFEMSTNYHYVREPPWDVPITCLTGVNDSYVTAENARAWGRFTKKQFQLFMLDSEHFIVVEDDEFLLRVINRELTSPL